MGPARTRYRRDVNRDGRRPAKYTICFAVANIRIGTILGVGAFIDVGTSKSELGRVWMCELRVDLELPLGDYVEFYSLISRHFVDVGESATDLMD